MHRRRLGDGTLRLLPGARAHPRRASSCPLTDGCAPPGAKPGSRSASGRANSAVTSCWLGPRAARAVQDLYDRAIFYPPRTPHPRQCPRFPARRAHYGLKARAHSAIDDPPTGSPRSPDPSSSARLGGLGLARRARRARPGSTRSAWHGRPGPAPPARPGTAGPARLHPLGWHGRPGPAPPARLARPTPAARLVQGPPCGMPDIWRYELFNEAGVGARLRSKIVSQDRWKISVHR
jgi:hypothetical protein